MAETQSVRLTRDQCVQIAIHFAKRYVGALDRAEYYRSKGYRNDTSEQRQARSDAAEETAVEHLSIVQAMTRRLDFSDVHWFAMQAAEAERDQRNRERADCARRYGVAA